MADASRASGPPLPTAETQEWFGREVSDALPALYGNALRLAGEPADAEDLVADAIAKAWSNLASLSDRSRFRSWLFRILMNTFLSDRRAAARRGPHEPLEDVDADFSLFERLHQPFLLWWDNPEQAFLDRLVRDDVQRALDAVPDVFRLPLLMADVQGFSYQEIADTLDVPIGTVRSRLARGRARLQKSLWQHARDAGIAGPVHPEGARP
jgi:RNA polymerase sigma-70 factor, ECF subfamily